MTDQMYEDRYGEWYFNNLDDNIVAYIESLEDDVEVPTNEVVKKSSDFDDFCEKRYENSFDRGDDNDDDR